ncbi:MAG TPA: hypothetical protein VMX58_13350 [Patescibacteria group bacterium]|nr:hypothetical protein [Patescibacteria group bacterium]
MRGQTIRTVVIHVIILCLAGGAADAQSIFGLNFIGEHRFRGSARQQALAFSTIALPDSNGALTSNTASLAELSEVTFSLFEVTNLSRIRTEEKSASQNRFQLPSIMIAIPLRDGLVFGLGYRTRFQGWGDFSYERDVAGVSNPLDIYKLRSTLFTAPLSLSWRVTDRIRVAGELQIERGSINDELAVYFPEEEYFGSVLSRRDRSFSGTSWSASVLIAVHPRIRIGAVFDDRVSYTVNQDITYSREEFDSSVSYDFELPPAFGAGVALGITDRWWITSNYWAREAPEPAGFSQLEGSLQDERLIAFGLERRRSAAGGFFSRIPLRFGYYENRWHLEFPAGEGVTARFVTLGTGLQVPGGPGSVDISLELGQIGSIDNNGIDERVMRIGVGLNVSEPWSRRKPGKR